MYHTKKAVDWHLSETNKVTLNKDEWTEICDDIQKESAMCEANSNAVLAEVRVLKARNKKLTDIINWMSNGYGINYMEIEYDTEMAELESEHFS